MTSAISSRLKGLKLTYTKYAIYDLVGESDADWSDDGLLIQAQRIWRSTQLGCQESGHSRFFHQKQKIREW